MMNRFLAVLTVAAAGALVCLPMSGWAHAADGHPARVQTGSCGNLGGVAFRLTGVGAALSAEGTPLPAPVSIGSPDATPVQTSATTLATTLSALTQDSHAIVIYESDEAMDRIIACGDIGGLLDAQMTGMVMPGDVLPIWLAGENDSGYSGVALLEAAGTEATLRVFLSREQQDHGTPQPDHAAQDGPGAAATPRAD